MTTISVGQTLKAAREAQRLSQEQVAETLRLMPDAIAALEEERWERFPAVVYARGHLASYARLLGIEPASLLLRMPSETLDPMGEDGELGSGGVNPWLVVGAIVVVAVVGFLLMGR
ncbi:MAG: hypothetical protein CMH55_04535 [Myxococcales bacterium]|nr:hypothetical protein [Myxococcales bacterium]